MTGKCPNCGVDFSCARCGYNEVFFVFMPMRFSIPADGLEVALAENVEFYMPEVWEKVKTHSSKNPVLIGTSLYWYSDKRTDKAPSGRVNRMPLSTYKLWGDSIREPKEYRERRDSDRKSKEAYLAAKI